MGYIKNLCSIHKSFKFLERFCDSLQLTDYSFLLATKQITLETVFILDGDFLLKIINILRDFIEEASSSNQVLQQNID